MEAVVLERKRESSVRKNLLRNNKKKHKIAINTILPNFYSINKGGEFIKPKIISF